MLSVEVLNAKKHQRAKFTCGEATLDRYIREQATQHHRDGVATTHVLIDDDHPGVIIGYYSLSAAQLLLEDLEEVDRKRLPKYPVPAIRMGRLAVALDEQKKGYGDYLVGHAVAKCLALRESLGVRVLIVDALNDSAARFYQAYGFRSTGTDARAFYLSLGKP